MKKTKTKKDDFKLVEDESFELTDIQPKQTGLSFQVYASDNSHGKRKTPHLRIDWFGDLFPISLKEPIRFLAGVPPNIKAEHLRGLKEFIGLNRNTLLDHWVGKNDSFQLLDLIRSIKSKQRANPKVKDKMLENYVDKVLMDFKKGKVVLDEARNILLQEMGRGNRILVIDENLLGVEPFLSNMGYTTDIVQRKLPDVQIKKIIRARVFITQNGKDFCDPEDMKRYYYGLVWVHSNPDDKITAEQISKVLMKSNFGRYLTKLVDVYKR